MALYFGDQSVSLTSVNSGSTNASDKIGTTADIPNYVKAEALSVATKVKNVQNANTLTFFVISDPHHCASQSDGWAAQTNKSNLHAMMGAKILAYALDADFSVCNGDLTFGNRATTADQLKEQVGEIKNWFSEAFRGIPQFFTVGNHDTGEYNEIVGAEYCMSQIMGASNATEFGNENIGKPYYYDLTDKKVRVICLNTCEGEMNGSDVYAISDGQLEWFANTLKDVGGKSDASAWGIIVIGHYPLDFGGARFLSDVLYHYIKGDAYTHNSVSVNFAGSNGATFIGNFHGHTHCLKSDKLHYYNNGTTPTAYHAHRLATPAASFYRNNEYTSAFHGVVFGEDTNYNKTADTGDDTAFCVNVVNLSDKVIHSFCYGAGYDRVVSYGPATYYTVTNNLTYVNTSSAAISVESGDAYETDLTASDGYAISEVTVTMGGIDITNATYVDGHISISQVTGNIVITATAVKTGYTNLIPLSKDKDGNPYNNGLGYKTGTRINSSSNEVAINGMCCTGFIPLTGKAGDVIRIKNVTYAGTASVYLICYSASHVGGQTFIQSDLEAATVDGVTTITTSKNGLYYMRLSCGVIDDTSIITVNEEIHGSTAYRRITNSLTHVTSNNAAVSVKDGTAYTATLTAESGYTMETVVVKMGGTDITSTAYTASNGVISIAEVTGDVTITATAIKIVTYTNLVSTAVDSSGASAPYTDGVLLKSSGNTSDGNHFTTTGFIPFDGGANHTYRIGGEGISWNEYGARIAWYNADFTLKGSVLGYDKIGFSIYFPTKVDDPNAAMAFSTDANFAPPNGAAYFRVSAKGSGANLIVTLDEEIT